jgi:hypothetical protein
MRVAAWRAGVPSPQASMAKESEKAREESTIDQRSGPVAKKTSEVPVDNALGLDTWEMEFKHRV